MTGPPDVTDSDAAAYGASPPVVDPIPVAFPREVLDSGIRTSPQSAGFGAWTSYVLAGTEKPFPVLPFDDSRARALVMVTAGAPAATEVLGVQPAAGAQFTYTVPAGGPPVILDSISGFFTASAAVANRFISCQILDAAGNTVASISNGSATVASTTIRVGFMASVGSNASSGSGTASFPIPLSRLLPGWQVKLNASSIDVADQWSQVVLTFNAAGGGLLYVGSQAQVQASPPLGGQIPAGMTAEVRNQQQLWAAPDGLNPVTVSVLVERWETKPLSAV